MRQTTTYRRLFNRTKLEGEVFSEDWPDAYFIEREVAVSAQWNYDAPGGSSTAAVYEFRGLYIGEDDTAQMCGPYKTLRNAMKAMNIKKEEEPERAPTVIADETISVTRKTASKKTKVDPELDALVESAEYRRIAFPRGYSIMFEALKKEAIREYAKKYKKKNGVFPTDCHTVRYGGSKTEVVNFSPKIKVFRYKKP